MCFTKSPIYDFTLDNGTNVEIAVLGARSPIALKVPENDATVFIHVSSRLTDS